MNLRKLNVGLVALVLGFGLVVTQSAFTPAKSNATLYGKVLVTPSNPSGWVDLTGMTEDNSSPYQDNSYRCEQSEEVCKAQFETPPTNHSSTPLPNSEIEGNFIIND
ncbi:MAG: hypothetical protein EOO88_34055 [Pedobacter sp.]|nr:MAG: hypothetical protein EOO88_34055 [Pedobacter sp.]